MSMPKQITTAISKKDRSFYPKRFVECEIEGWEYVLVMETTSVDAILNSKISNHRNA